jgi:hypothetical protein
MAGSVSTCDLVGGYGVWAVRMCTGGCGLCVQVCMDGCRLCPGVYERTQGTCQVWVSRYAWMAAGCVGVYPCVSRCVWMTTGHMSSCVQCVCV